MSQEEDTEYSTSTEKVLDTLGSDFTPPTKPATTYRRTYYPPTTYDSYNYYGDSYGGDYSATGEDTTAIAKAYIEMFVEDPSMIRACVGGETLLVTLEIIKQLIEEKVEKGDKHYV